MIRLTAVCALLSAVCSLSLIPLEACAADTASRWGSLQFIGPDTISDIAMAAAPAVVNIVANSSMVRRPLGQRAQPDTTKKLRRYYGIDQGQGEPEVMKVTGSGVVVRADGYILTSLHVVENASSVTVTLQDGRSFEGNITAKDRFSDLAIIKIPASNLPVVTFGNAEKLRLGDWVIAIGNQFGLGHSVTHGLVSGLGREAKGFEKSFGARTGAVRFIQTDAPINPGSSGGPLLNLKGEVVGINTFIRDDAQNIGFAIPSNMAKDVAEKLTNTGEIAHPYIGIVMRETASGSGGIEVLEVKFRSPASSAGIAPGDVITQVQDQNVYKSDDVSLAVAKCQVGENIKLRVKQQNGQEKDFAVKIERLPDDHD